MSNLFALRTFVLVAIFLAAMTAPACGGGVGDGGSPCPWDIDGSGDAGFGDLTAVLIAWGTDGSAGGDVNGDGDVGFADLTEVLLHWGACPPRKAARFFGWYTGTADVTDSEYFPPGTYPAEAAVAQTESGVVGYINITFDPGDVLGGIITHPFSGVVTGGSEIELQYGDRMCGGGDLVGLCYPHYAEGYTQYSFHGSAAVDGDELVLAQPKFLPDLPYSTTLLFDSATLTRAPNPPRTTFNGNYLKLEYVWMGTVIVLLPLPLYGHNEVKITAGEIISWKNNGFLIALPPAPQPVINSWCFDDRAGLGWMNQQSEWFYHWVLDAEGEGLCVIATFADFENSPDCDAMTDPLAGDGLDTMHQNLAGMLFEVP